MRLPLPPDGVPVRVPDVLEGVVGPFAPAAASPVPVLGVAAPAPFCLAAELAVGVASPLPVFAAVCLGEPEVPVCLGVAAEREAAPVLLARLTGVVGLEVRPCPV